MRVSSVCVNTDERPALATPTWAAIAGISYGVIMVVVITLRHLSLPPAPTNADWALNPAGLRAATTATTLIPFAGIAFLWFIGVLRAELGKREDQFFATVMLGSGLLYVAMSFAGGATTGALLVLINLGYPGTDHAVAALQMLTMELSGTFGARMAAVFVIVVTTIGRKSGIMAKPFIVIGYVVAVILMFSPPLTRWTQLLFPMWVMLLSVMILVRARRRRALT